MKAVNVLMPVFFLIALCFSKENDISLHGTVKNQSGEPVENASVFLKSLNQPENTVYTDGEGSFSLSRQTKIISGQRSNFSGIGISAVMKGEQLLLLMDGSGRDIMVDIFGIDGARIHSQKVSNRTACVYAVTLSAKSRNLYIVKLSMGEMQQVFRVISGMNAGTFSGPAVRSAGSDNNPERSRIYSGYIDTLVIVAQGYRNKKRGISAHISEESLMIELSRSNPWIPEGPLEYEGGMVKIRANGYDFEMGQPDDYILGDLRTGEYPVHTVNFTYDFWMDTIGVTEQKFSRVMSSAYPEIYIRPGIDTINQASLVFWNHTESHPVFHVGHSDAILYCNALSKEEGLDTVYTYESISGSVGLRSELSGLSADYSKNGYRLPFEAEYEYAARGGTFTDYFWGANYKDYLSVQDNEGMAEIIEEINQYAAWYENSKLSLSDEMVGLKPAATGLPNDYGLYDMTGNVLEYVLAPYYDYPWHEVTYPVESTDRGYFYFRGASWLCRKFHLRHTTRDFQIDGYELEWMLGFRTVRIAQD